jgi:Reverse transcriptase (RNA-dependent DNA polymerase)/gag-polypeptide of LTR copia-type
MDDFLNKKRPVPVLTRENWEQWFKLMESYLRSKSQFYVTETTLKEYAWIQRLVDNSSTKPKPSTSATPTTESDVDSLTSSFEKLGGSWNQDKKDKFEADASGVEYLITICTSQFDNELMEEYATIKTKWLALKAKYSRILPATNRRNLQLLTAFKMEDNMTIEDAWTRLHELRRRVVTEDSSLKGAFTKAGLFQYLLAALPIDYSAIRDSLDTQPDVPIETKLKMLQSKEQRVQDEQTALVARQQSYRSERSSRSHGRFNPPGGLNARSTSRPRQLECYLCGKDHFVKDCPIRDEMRQFVRERKSLSRSHSQKPMTKHHRSKPHLSSRKDHRQSKPHRQSSYKAELDVKDEPSDEHDSVYSTTTESDSESYVEEVAAISKVDKSKIPPSNWVADSGASTHMTDHFQLFRGPLTSVKTHLIRVGGGRLYANQMGTVELRTPKGRGSVLLANVLFVPHLGANLLSTRKICRNGLEGTFDNKRMYFKKDNKIVIKAKQQDGLYVVSSVASGYEEVALPARVTKESTTSSEKVPMTSLVETVSTSHPTTRFPRPGLGNGQACRTGTTSVISKDNSQSGNKDLPNKEIKRYQLFHRRFAHLGPNTLRRLHQVTTLKRPIKVPTNLEICDVCARTKLRNSTSKVLSPWKEQVLELVQIDICGPLPKTLRSNTYFAQVIDNATRKTWSIPGKSKSDVASKLRTWKLSAELHSGMKLRSARSDNAPELVELLSDWQSVGGSNVEFTATYRSHQNGVAERSIQTAESDARAMLKDAGLPIEFWDEAVQADAYIRNRTGTGPLINSQRISPEEAYSGTKPSIDHIRVWGSKCYSYVDPKSLPAHGRTDKLMDRGRIAVFMGYSESTDKHYRIYAPDLGRTVFSSVVVFDEEKKGGEVDLKIRMLEAGPQGTANDIPTRKSKGRPMQTVPDVRHTMPATLNNFEIRIPATTLLETLPKDSVISKSIPEDAPLAPPEPPMHHPDLTRPAGEIKDHAVLAPQPVKTDLLNSTREINSSTAPQMYFLRKRKRDSDDNNGDEPLSKAIKAMLAMIRESDTEVLEHTLIAGTLIPIPRNYKEAINDPIYGEQWKEAINSEITSLQTNKTWKEEIAPTGTNLVSTKWVFALKTDAYGTVDRFKARLVARGFSQVYGLDYFETFAPTVRADTLRAFLAIVAAEDLECHQYDIKNAFTESILKERIYLSPPTGVPVRDGYALRVLRSIYGLKQSARDWNRLCKDHLLANGFIQSLADPCLFVNDARQLMILVYVDDIIAAAKSNMSISWFSKALSSRFNTKNLGEISKVLGIHVTRDRPNRTMYIDQQQYLDTVLNRFGITHGTHKRKTVPVTGYEQLRSSQASDIRIDPTEYQRAIGSIMYSMVYTRPDIAFAIGRLSQYMTDPSEHHGHAVKGLMRYLRSTIAQKIRYGPSGHKPLILYSDADWASDRTDRKSISGTVSMLYGGPIMWRSTKQTSVATSSTESEYIAMSQCSKSSQWIAQILRDMNYPQYIGVRPTTVDIRGDNQGALALVRNPHLHERSKHIDICYHYIRDLEEKNKVSVTYIPTGDMAADGFTKPLASVLFDRFKSLLGLV